jgi:hypothetical protein
MRPIPRLLLAGLATLALPAWGAKAPASGQTLVPEPAEAEIERLYRERIDWINQGSVRFLGVLGAQKVLIRVESLKKLECKSEVKGVYACAVFVDSAVGKALAETKRLTLTLAKDGDDWRLK